MDWVWLTAFSIISRSIYGVMTKVLSNHVKTSAYTQATILSLSGGLIALIISPILGGLHLNFAHASLLAALLVVSGQGLGNIFYFSAIKKLTNGTAQIAFSSILVWNTVLALTFLNLHLSFINVFGLVLLMLAILSVANGKIELDKQGIGLMLLAAFLFSIFQLASSSLSKEVGAVTYLVVAYFGAAAVVFLLKSKDVIADVTSASKRHALGIPLITAVPSLGNFAFAYYAYRDAPQGAKVAMLLTSQVVLTVFLSYIFLKEKDHLWRKAGAAALVVIAAILIKQ